MSSKPILFVAAVFSAALLAPGCGGKGKVEQAKTPKQAVVNFAKAIETCDKGLFLASIHSGDQALAEATFDGLQAMLTFQKKFEKEYGKEAAKKAGIGLQNPPTAAEVEKKAQIEQKDGKTVAVVDKEPMPLVEKDGLWKVDISEMTQGQDTKQALEMAQKMKTAAQNAEAKVGKPQYKDHPEKIIVEMVTEVTGFDMQKMAEGMADQMKKSLEAAPKTMPAPRN